MEIKKIEKVIIKYVRNKKGYPFAVIVAIDSNKIGWAMCHKDDRWNKNLGKTIAINRAWKGISRKNTILTAPYKLTDAINNMYDRADKYFNK